MQPLGFGIFNAPYHHMGQNPTLAIERDIQLVEHVEALGYDEAWFGEHHSAGWELIASPEVMIASAAARTKRIKLGTGVNSLAYQHPFMLAERWLLLDHLTRGRAMFGAGPGALASDAYMMGIDPLQQRRMMEESLGAIVALMSGEVVTQETDWFTLNEARLQLRPFSYPMPDIRPAAIVSPSGPRTAGRLGLGLLSMGATSVVGFERMREAWDLTLEEATQHGHVPDRRRWSVAGPMHIAPTEEQAREEARYGVLQWYEYWRTVATVPFPPVNGVDEAIDVINDMGFGVIGSPEQAITQIQRLLDQSGGFGTYLIQNNDWADWHATKRSLETIAHLVMPHFQGQLTAQQESFAWVESRHEEFQGQFKAAQNKAKTDHEAEKSPLNQPQ